MFADITDIQTDTTSLMAFGTTKKNSHFYGVTKYFTKYVKHIKIRNIEDFFFQFSSAKMLIHIFIVFHHLLLFFFNCWIKHFKYFC